MTLASRPPGSLSKRLIIEPINGLANRLTAVASGQRLAKLLNRRLTILWANNYPHPFHRCPSHIADLFDTDLDVCSSFEEVNSSSMVRLIRNPQAAPLPEVRDAIQLPKPWIDTRAYADTEVIAVTTFNFATLAGMDQAAEIQEVVINIQRLVPKPAITQAVEAYVQSHFKGSTVGIHVRRTDFKQMLSHLGLPEAADDDYWALMDRCLSIRAETKFFLASDCGETKERFVMRYGPATCLHYVPNTGGGSDTNNQAALIDMLLLSKTDYICCDPYSSFSRFALARKGALSAGYLVPPGIRGNPRLLEKLAVKITSTFTS